MNEAQGLADHSRPPLLHRVEDTLLVLLFGSLLTLAFAHILLRNLFAVTWLWADPLMRHLVLWSSFLGALIATRQERHIRIDAVLRLLPPRWSQVAAGAGDAIAAGVCLTVARVAVRFVVDEYQYGSNTFLELPRWILQLVFPVVFTAMGLRFAHRVLHRWRHRHDG